MEEKVISRSELRHIINNDQALKSGRVYLHNQDVYKIFNMHPKYSERNVTYFCYDLSDSLDVNQIRALSSMRDYIKNTKMVREIIKCAGVYIGIIYDFFDGYRPFCFLDQEDKDIIFHNLKSLIENNNELMAHDVYHLDLHPRNVLYNKKDVQIIDIDGPYICFDDAYIPRVLKNLYNTVLEIIFHKLLTQYSKDEAKLIMKDVIKAIGKQVCITQLSYKDIEKVENLKIIK